MIDEEATFKEFGYHSDDLTPQSHKKIVVVCEICNKRRSLQMCNYTNSRSYIKNGLSLCLACSTMLYHGESNGFFCKHHTQETKQMISIKKKGQPGFWKGKQLPDETRKKISDNHADFSKENHPGWKGGVSNLPYCELWNESFKEKIRNKYDRVCFLCGKTEKKNKKKLSVHHVNYGKMCMCDYDCRFVPLCTSCHARTNHNRYYWFSMIMCKLNLEFSGSFVDFMVVI